MKTNNKCHNLNLFRVKFMLAKKFLFPSSKGV